MRVLFKPVGQDAHPLEIPNTLQAMQELVGGPIEVIRTTRRTCCIVHEEGKLRHMWPNFWLYNDLIVGNAVFVGVKGDGFRDITDDEITQCRRKIKLEAPKYERR